MKVHYPKLYNMAFNVFTDFKGSDNYILFILLLKRYIVGTRQNGLGYRL